LGVVHRSTCIFVLSEIPRADTKLIVTSLASNCRGHTCAVSYRIVEPHRVFSGLQELGKNWTEIAARFGGSKTDGQCRRFYVTQRQKLSLDDLTDEYLASEANDVVVFFCFK